MSSIRHLVFESIPKGIFKAKSSQKKHRMAAWDGDL